MYLGRRILENLTVGYGSGDFPVDIRPVISLPCSQEPTTCSYPEPDESSPDIQFFFIEL